MTLRDSLRKCCRYLGEAPWVFERLESPSNLITTNKPDQGGQVPQSKYLLVDIEAVIQSHHFQANSFRVAIMRDPLRVVRLQVREKHFGSTQKLPRCQRGRPIMRFPLIHRVVNLDS